MNEPTTDDLLNEVRRLKAENARLYRLMQARRPDLDALRDVEVALRDMVSDCELRGHGIKQMQQQVQALIGTYDDLPSTEELSGIWGDGKARVEAALTQEPNP